MEVTLATVIGRQEKMLGAVACAVTCTRTINGGMPNVTIPIPGTSKNLHAKWRVSTFKGIDNDIKISVNCGRFEKCIGKHFSIHCWNYTFRLLQHLPPLHQRQCRQQLLEQLQCRVRVLMSTVILTHGIQFLAMTTINYLQIWSNLGNGRFLAISRAECPWTDHNTAGCDLPDCYSKFNDGCMFKNDLCEADHTLPDGSNDYNIDNCPPGYDVFRYVFETSKFELLCFFITSLVY